MQFQPDELNIISYSAPIFLKMLREREKRILDRIYGEYRNGKKDFLEQIAEYAVVREQINEITTALAARDGQN